MSYNYFPKNSGELNNIVQGLIIKNGYTVDLNCIDVSNITDMSYLFYNSKFNGDISKWNVSKVTDINTIFVKSRFNGILPNFNFDDILFKHSAFINCRLNYINCKKLDDASHRLVKQFNLIRRLVDF